MDLILQVLVAPKYSRDGTWHDRHPAEKRAVGVDGRGAGKPSGWHGGLRMPAGSRGARAEKKMLRREKARENRGGGRRKPGMLPGYPGAGAVSEGSWVRTASPQPPLSGNGPFS